MSYCPYCLLTVRQWSNIEATAKSSIQEKKIRVLFLPAEGSAAVNGVRHADDPPAYSSPTPDPRTPQRMSDAPVVGSVSTPQLRSVDNKYAGDARESTGSAGQQSTVGAAAASVGNMLPSSDDVKAQLASANETITRLRQQVEEQGLRQRKSDAVNQDSKERITTGTTGMGVQQAPASGVPVQIVAGLCLLCFLVAYFFF